VVYGSLHNSITPIFYLQIKLQKYHSAYTAAAMTNTHHIISQPGNYLTTVKMTKPVEEQNTSSEGGNTRKRRLSKRERKNLKKKKVDVNVVKKEASALSAGADSGKL
jgi:hypothetical protein